jgi:hypothetical protein
MKISQEVSEQDAENMEKFNDFLLEQIGEYVVGTKIDALTVAAILMSNAMRMYRTALPDEDYDMYCTYVYENRHRIMPYEMPVLQ